LIYRVRLVVVAHTRNKATAAATKRPKLIVHKKSSSSLLLAPSILLILMQCQFQRAHNKNGKARSVAWCGERQQVINLSYLINSKEGSTQTVHLELIWCDI